MPGTPDARPEAGTPPERPAVAGVVLAGGRSRRFGDEGEQKALAMRGDRTLLGRTLDVLAEATDRPPVVAVRTAAQRAAYVPVVADRGARFAFDATGHEGPLGGLLGAVAAVETPWLFCVGCDMPLLSPAAVGWQVARLEGRHGRDPPDAVVVQHDDGTRDPLHALYRTAAVRDRRDDLDGGAGPRALLDALDVRAVPADSGPDGCSLARSTTNVNTRAALDALARPPEQ